MSGKRHLGGYELRGVLGRGVSAIVYLGWDVQRAREVAIKALDPALFASPGVRERFRAEAQVLIGVSHPNVLAVCDYLEDRSGAWLVTEHVRGASLAQVLGRAGRLGPEQALDVLAGALSGLAHAHRLGLVHGDVKPSNILVSGKGVSKLCDFGQAIPAGVISTGGTAAYMSPEAARGEPVDHRSDIYSAGVVLYEALTGNLPFIAAHELALVHMHAAEAAPRASGLHPALADLLQRTLAKDPAARPQSAQELLADLEAAAESAYGCDWRRRAAIGALIASITAGAAVLAEAAPAAGETLALTGGSASPPRRMAIGSGARRASWAARLLGAHKAGMALLAVTVVVGAGAGALITEAVRGRRASYPAHVQTGARSRKAAMAHSRKMGSCHRRAGIFCLRQNGTTQGRQTNAQPAGSVSLQAGNTGISLCKAYLEQVVPGASGPGGSATPRLRDESSGPIEADGSASGVPPAEVKAAVEDQATLYAVAERKAPPADRPGIHVLHQALASLWKLIAEDGYNLERVNSDPRRSSSTFSAVRARTVGGEALKTALAWLQRQGAICAERAEGVVQPAICSAMQSTLLPGTPPGKLEDRLQQSSISPSEAKADVAAEQVLMNTIRRRSPSRFGYTWRLAGKRLERAIAKLAADGYHVRGGTVEVRESLTAIGESLRAAREAGQETNGAGVWLERVIVRCAHVDQRPSRARS